MFSSKSRRWSHEVTPFAAWLIDLDGTLYRPLPVKVAMGLQLCFASSHTRKIIRSFRHEHEALRASEETTIDQPFTEQLSRTAQRLGYSVEQVREIIDDWMFVRPGRWLRRFRREDLIKEIAQFKATGGRTALISDYPAREVAGVGSDRTLRRRCRERRD